jgi:hypothetical protein
MLKAYDVKTGREVKQGDVVVDFRGAKSYFAGCARANRINVDGRSGKVYVSSTKKGVKEAAKGFGVAYYDKVFDLVVKGAQ